MPGYPHLGQLHDFVNLLLDGLLNLLQVCGLNADVQREDQLADTLDGIPAAQEVEGRDIRGEGP